MANQSIKIPIELELNQLQSQITTLKNALKGVKPESDSWNKLTGIIGKLESQMDALRRHSTKAFSSTAEIKGFEKEFNRVVEGVETAADAFKRLKFSELEIDPNSLSSINELNLKIEEVKKNIKEAEKVNIGNFLSTEESKFDLKDLLSRSGIASLPNTFKEIVSIFTKQSNELQKQINVLLEKEKELVDKTKNYEKSLSSEDGFDSIFLKYADTANFENGKLKKDVGLSLKNELLGLNVGITQEDIKKLLSVDSVDFANAFLAIKEGVLREYDNLKNQIDIKIQEIKRKQGDVESFSQLKKDVESAQEDFEGNISSGLKNQLADLIAQLKSAKQEQVNLSSVMAQAKSVLSSTSQIYSNLTQQIAKSETQLSSMIKVQEQLDGIRKAAVRFLGFNEIINTTKRVVKDAATEIKELDSVMTEIAVVTDMTQEDLWAQMDTYEEIANQYGVSIRGTYEVSQLFYQQGKWLNI